MTAKEQAAIRRLDRFCRYIYGARWQADLARDLKLNERTVRSWVQGRTGITPEVWRKVADRLETKIERADGMQKLMQAQINSLPKEG